VKRPARIPSRLPESLHKRLNAYSLAASAAGVGVLALVAQPAEGKIVYTPAHVKIGLGGVDVYRLDINHDGVPDFMFSRFVFDTYGIAVCAVPKNKSASCRSARKVNRNNEIWGYTRGTSFGFASALRHGDRIAANRKHFLSHNFFLATANCGSGSCDYGGPWSNIADANGRYLGLKFVIKGKIHYGWARLSFAMPAFARATLTGYAYETIPNKPIIAGKTHGADDDSSVQPNGADPGPSASLTTPIPHASQPASLGALALGTPGLLIWRRKETAIESN
jgi:hypothetical protein